MSYIETMKKIEKGNIGSVYVVYGSEPYFIKNIRDALIKKVINGNTENLSEYDLHDTTIQDVIADVETFPFFGDRKLIIANNPVFLKAKPEKLIIEHTVEALESYLTNPVDYSVLLITANIEKLDERKKITKLLKKQATFVEAQEVKEYQSEEWIERLAGRYSIHIEKEALTVFASEVGMNLNILENEMNKLALFIGENGTVTKEIAEELLAHSTDNTAIKLVDAVLGKDLKKAIQIYKDLEKNNEEPIGMIGLLAYQFRLLLRVKTYKQKGYTQHQIQKAIGGHPYGIKLAMNREQHFSREKLESIIIELANTDTVMKTGTMEKGLAFEMLLYKLIAKNN